MLRLAEDPLKGCGGKIWGPASTILCDYLLQLGPEYLRDKRVVELGSGTGIVGLFALQLSTMSESPPVNLYDTICLSNPSIFEHSHDSHDNNEDVENRHENKRIEKDDNQLEQLFSISSDNCYNTLESLVLTDRGEICKLLEENARLAFPNAMIQRRIVVEHLDWGTDDCRKLTGRIDLILISECVYLEECFEPLLNTLQSIMQPETVCLMSYTRRRRAEKRFFKQLEKLFTVRQITNDRNYLDYSKRRLFLFEIKLKV